ncbi:acyltransferase [Microbacterium paludicola]|uniref:acyltransferase family protein n=1 Tax=Microbacterium paludicola TaxID=300019 RepID=UPI0011A3302A|nr:acyltransferase [Microbacterium paludicola]
MTIADLRRTPAPARPPGAGRDTGIDLVRALCVIGVVVIHALMVGITIDSTGPVFANASEGSAWIVPLSWLLQVMPLFFVIGGFAGRTAYLRMTDQGRSATDFVSARIHRLLLPALYAIAAVGVLLAMLLTSGVPEELVGVAGYRFSQPLWFLGVFLICQVLLPALVAAHERAPWTTIGLLALGAVAVDAARILSGVDAIGFVNLALVWLTLQQLGFFLADGSVTALSRRARAMLAVAAVAALAGTFVLGIHSPDLIANINPPTTALLLVGVAHTMLVSLLQAPLNRWSRSPLGVRLREFITPRAMTIYLWHMPVLLAMAGLSAAFAMLTGLALPAPGGLAWWATRPLWLAVVFAGVVALARAAAGLEARRPPAPTASHTRLTAATVIGGGGVVLLLAVGTSPFTAGVAVLSMVAAIRLASTRRGDAVAMSVAGQSGSAP